MKETNRREFIQQTTGTMAAIALIPSLESLAFMTLAEPIKVALIGAGRQGRAILGELQKIDGVTVSAICDVVPSRLSSGLRRAKNATGYNNHVELLEKSDNVVAVFIATPTHLHADIAIDCLEAGKHVYCEAPLASSVEDCKRIVKAARNANTVFHCGMQSRSNPIYKLARSFVRTDAVRDLIAITGQYHRKTSWQTPSRDPVYRKLLNWRLDPEVSIGLAGEFGTHQFDAMNWFANAYPISVTGHGAVRLWKDGRKIPDTVLCSMRYANGLQMQYNATICNSFESRTETFLGSMAAVKLSWTSGWMFKEADAPTQGWEVYAFREQFHNEEGIVLIADATKLASQGKLKKGVGLPFPPLYYSLVDFFKSITEEKPPVCTAEEGMRGAVIGIMANKAITEGKEVNIPTVSETE